VSEGSSEAPEASTGSGGAHRGRERSALLRRAPFFLFIALGLFLWKSPWFPQERTLVWQLPRMEAPVREVEIQIWNDQQELLKRELWRFQDSSPGDVSQKLSLKQGSYRAHAFLVSASGERRRWSGPLDVAGEETLIVPVR
jgi:hypothetical protein